MNGGVGEQLKSVSYSAGSLELPGPTIYDEARSAASAAADGAELAWRYRRSIDVGKMLAEEGYVVFVADMFGEGKGPKGDENPMEFLEPLIENAAETRRAHRRRRSTP